MSSVVKGMAMGNDALYFLLRDAFLENTVNTSLKNNGIISIIMLKVIEGIFSSDAK